MFTDTFMKLIGVILVLAALILVAVVAGLVPPGNQANVLTIFIAFIVGCIGVTMALGWFSAPPDSSKHQSAH